MLHCVRLSSASLSDKCTVTLIARNDQSVECPHVLQHGLTNQENKHWKGPKTGEPKDVINEEMGSSPASVKITETGEGGPLQVC
jgi:hypothetical protein